eukprot:1158661-Pelagomonas_calceolata.AAC.9
MPIAMHYHSASALFHPRSSVSSCAQVACVFSPACTRTFPLPSKSLFSNAPAHAQAWSLMPRTSVSHTLIVAHKASASHALIFHRVSSAVLLRTLRHGV